MPSQDDIENTKEALAALAIKGTYAEEMIELARCYFNLTSMEAFRLNLMLSSGTQVLSMGTSKVIELINGEVVRVTTQIEHPDFLLMDDNSEDWKETIRQLDALEDQTAYLECLWFHLATPIGHDDVHFCLSSFYRC